MGFLLAGPEGRHPLIAGPKGRHPFIYLNLLFNIFSPAPQGPARNFYSFHEGLFSISCRPWGLSAPVGRHTLMVGLPAPRAGSLAGPWAGSWPWGRHLAGGIAEYFCSAGLWPEFHHY